MCQYSGPEKLMAARTKKNTNGELLEPSIFYITERCDT